MLRRLSPASLPRLFSRTLSTQAQSELFTRLSLPTSTPSSPLPGVYHGTWTGSGRITTSTNPSTGSVLGYVQEASKEDLEEALKKSRDAYKLWREVPAPRRGEVLRRIRGAMEGKIDDLGLLISLEMGKIKSEGRGASPPFSSVRVGWTDERE